MTKRDKIAASGFRVIPTTKFKGSKEDRIEVRLSPEATELLMQIKEVEERLNITLDEIYKLKEFARGVTRFLEVEIKTDRGE